MDPKVSIENAIECFMEGNHVAAMQYIDAYLDWRRKGGFEPFCGADIDARFIVAAIRAEQDRNLAALAGQLKQD